MKFNKTFQIDGRVIGDGCKPYIIAEMSANHGNNIEIAKKIVIAAKKAGADAVKIQTYSADSITLDCKTSAFEAKGAWEGVYLYDLYKEAAMPWKWTSELQKLAKEIGITLFSSPFDFEAVEFLETLNMPAYKIASPEIVDLPLVRRIAQTNKPVILSTGNATISQINDAVAVLTKEKSEFAILKCTSEYPADPKDINLKSIPFLKELFKCPVGLSDHTLGTAIPIASVALGCDIIEKHFILDRKQKTVDSFFSATPNELKAIVEGTQMVQDALGEISFPIIPNKSQRSLIAIKDINEGEVFEENKNFRSIRPGGGIESKEIKKIIGRKSMHFIPRGSLLSWDDIGGL
ncbi:pseudaminic acid synthase [Sulfurimonas sp. SWIR-19]|uniref:pseudaminic acid synthase n=1 Tax=Sulfurimonas sp. SWIR-19 TaxID=2878390 RepID=UPI001CF4D6A4|nr:pseudaminic acid synthase [Sulfurimonas sp. SWIR-19]UCN00490.1 pseudaminic acid synthase [Sulfurimonas sp. SWIR-19]